LGFRVQGSIRAHLKNSTPTHSNSIPAASQQARTAFQQHSATPEQHTSRIPAHSSSIPGAFQRARAAFQQHSGTFEQHSSNIPAHSNSIPAAFQHHRTTLQQHSSTSLAIYCGFARFHGFQWCSSLRHVYGHATQVQTRAVFASIDSGSFLFFSSARWHLVGVRRHHHMLAIVAAMRVRWLSHRGSRSSQVCSAKGAASQLRRSSGGTTRWSSSMGSVGA